MLHLRNFILVIFVVVFENPDEITVHATSEVRAADGIYSDTYALSDIVKYV